MTQKLVVISGPANTGKMPLARKLAADHPEYKIVHRDDLRRMFVNEVPEDQISWAMYDVAKGLLAHGHTVLIVAWNLEKVDRTMWAKLARVAVVPLEWLDITRPEVAAMIPPMEAPAPVSREDAPKLLRSLERWEKCMAAAVTGGSTEQMRCFVEDAKADIATLARLAKVRR